MLKFKFRQHASNLIRYFKRHLTVSICSPEINSKFMELPIFIFLLSTAFVQFYFYTYFSRKAQWFHFTNERIKAPKQLSNLLKIVIFSSGRSAVCQPLSWSLWDRGSTHGKNMEMAENQLWLLYGEGTGNPFQSHHFCVCVSRTETLRSFQTFLMFPLLEKLLNPSLLVSIPQVDRPLLRWGMAAKLPLLYSF